MLCFPFILDKQNTPSHLNTVTKISPTNKKDSPPKSVPPLLGELLIEGENLSQAELEKGLELQKEIGGRIGAILIRTGAISEDTLLEALSSQTGLPLFTIDDLPADTAAQLLWLETLNITLDWWFDQEVLAWQQKETTFCVARDPFDNFIVEVIEKNFLHTDSEAVQWGLIRNHDLDLILDRLSSLSQQKATGKSSDNYLREMAEEAPVIEFVNNMFSLAFDQNGSDIHIEPEKYNVRIRIRIDGILYERFNLPIERFNAIASRIKLISDMDIAEQRLPQDGQIETRVSGEEVDIRVSSLPGVHGESIVMRLLPKEKQKFSIDSIGLAAKNLENLNTWASQPHGIILVTGPTGSGKSTTLYSLLDSINTGDRKIITVEDPVEYRLPGITQIQTLEDIDYTFARALRAVLRQDPDVVMIGEIRDGETAEIAIQASLTGHLVLSTLHTNDASSAFTRLIDMGIDPFLVATPIRAVMAQRLVRRLCPACATSYTPLDDIQTAMQSIANYKHHPEQALWQQHQGCERCRETGYNGRIGIHEMLPVTPGIQHLIIERAATSAITALAHSEGMRTLREDGFIKACKGLTAIEEVLRVTAG